MEKGEEYFVKGKETSILETELTWERAWNISSEVRVFWFVRDSDRVYMAKGEEYFFRGRVFCCIMF